MSARGKTAIIVDDGIATGLTMRAAASELRNRRPARLIIAVPCAPADAVSDLLEVADEVIVLADLGDYYGAVAMYYDDFPQLTDDEVATLLASLEGFDGFRSGQ